MKTTQKASRESTVYSHNSHKMLIIVFLIILAVILAFTLLIYRNHKNAYTSAIYDNADQVIEMFEENFEDFDKFMDVINDHHAFRDILDENGRTDIFDYKNVKKYMSKDEYDTVQKFWFQYRPEYMRNGSVTFKIDSGEVKFFLLKDFTDDQLARKMDLEEQFGKVIELHDDWYCLIKTW